MKHNSIPPCSPTVLPLLDAQYPSQKDVASTTGSFPLKKGAVDSSCTAATGGGDAGPLLPFWGQFSCRLMAQPVYTTSSRTSGFIYVQQMVSGLTN